MTDYVTLAQAKAIAEKQARADLIEFIRPTQEVLAVNILEAENCWMFFRNERIDVPIDAMLGIKWAYVVSKKGTFSMVQDLSDEPERVQVYLQTLSDHFQAIGE